MNSFSTFTHSTPSILPPYTTLSNFNALKNKVNIPPLEIPSLNSFSPIMANNYSPLPRTINLNNFTLPNSQSPLKGSLSPVNQELASLLLSWKLQQNMQAELLKAQMDHISELKNSLIEKFSQIQSQSSHSEKSSPESSQAKPFSFEGKAVNIKDTNNAKMETLKELAKPVHRSPAKDKDLRSQIRDIVNFVLDNFGRINESSFDEEKLNYSHNRDLMMVFDLLTSKYSSTIKTKEEMVKYTLRRAFKFIKSHIKKAANTNTKGVSKTLCNQYFNASQDEILRVGNEEDFLKSVLPFRKNSRNKTMNTSFIGEVFSSDNFRRDYELYLKNFDSILENDNTNKIDRLVEFIEDCVKANKTQDIKKYKRIPWPKLWIANTKKIAQDLPALGTQGSPDLSKKIKTEENFGDSMGDMDCDSEMSGDSTH